MTKAEIKHIKSKIAKFEKAIAEAQARGEKAHPVMVQWIKEYREQLVSA